MNAPIANRPKMCWSAPGKILPGSLTDQVNLQSGVLAEAGNYTVQFAVSDENALTVADHVILKADIEWFVDGVAIKRTINVVNGASITGVCEKVAVKVYDASVVVSTSPAALKRVDITITLAKGTRANIQQPPTLSVDGEIVMGAGATRNFPIPNNVGAISVMVTVRPATIGGAIGAYDVLVSQINNIVLKGYDPRQTDWVPLAPGATILSISTSAAAPVDTRFQITYGIEG